MQIKRKYKLLLQLQVENWLHKFMKQLPQIAKIFTPEIRVSNFVGGTDKQRQLKPSAPSAATGRSRHAR